MPRAEHRPTRAAALLTAAGLVLLAVPLAGSLRASAAETTLFSYSLVGAARGARLAYEDPTQAAQMEGEAPEASVSLITGGLGYGLASLAWPGATAGNIGTLMQTVAPGTPPQASFLNWPVRAEARTGQEPESVSNDGVPGASMKAAATADRVDAVASLSRTQGSGAELGTIRSTASAWLEERAGRATAEIAASDLVVGGVVRIAAIHSASSGSTDGVRATGAARTTVTGLTVAGMPATVDERGITFGSSSSPLHAALNEAARAVLERSGITVTLSAPTRRIEGATGRFTAGTVVVTMPGGSGARFVMAIGGASTVVTASPGEPPALVPGGTTDVAPRGDAGPAESPEPSDAVGAPAPAGPEPAAAPSPAAEEPAVDLAAPRPAVAGVGFDGLDPALLVVGAVGALLAALGLRRFTDAVLAAADTGPPCPLVEP